MSVLRVHLCGTMIRQCIALQDLNLALCLIGRPWWNCMEIFQIYVHLGEISKE